MQRDDAVMIAWKSDREPPVVAHRHIFDYHEPQLFCIEIKRFIKVHYQQTTDQITLHHFVILRCSSVRVQCNQPWSAAIVKIRHCRGRGTFLEISASPRPIRGYGWLQNG